MNESTQRLANYFPEWSMIRQDPSSFGHRLLSIWGDYFDWARIDLKRYKDGYDLLAPGLGRSHVWYLQLEEADFITNDQSVSGQLIWTYPTLVQGDRNLSTITLTRVDNYDDLFMSVTDAIEEADQVGVSNFLVYSDNRAGTIVQNTIDFPNRLLIVISGSTNYYPKTKESNLMASGSHYVRIKGYDQNSILIEEQIDILDDGNYWSKNIFTEITEVELEGFDGLISIYISAVTDYIVDPYRICVTDELEGPLRLSFSEDNTNTILRYFTLQNISGTEYREGNTPIMDIEVTKWRQYLLDASSQPIVAVDIALSPNDTRLYVLDINNKVHIYEHGPSIFTPPSLESTLTKASYLDLIPIRYDAILNEEITFFTRFTRMRYPIYGLKIFRKDPSNNIEYLQVDKTWGATQYQFAGINLERDPSAPDSWKDFAFTSVCDELGKFEFYAEVLTQYDTTITTTSVMVDSLVAKKSLTLTATNTLGLFFGPDDRLSILSTNDADTKANSIYIYDERSNVYYADPQRQLLFFKEEYDQITVTP